jgi:hypothetical protein
MQQKIFHRYLVWISAYVLGSMMLNSMAFVNQSGNTDTKTSRTKHHQNQSVSDKSKPDRNNDNRPAAEACTLKLS